MGVCNCSMFCCTLLYVHFSIAIILMGKGELIALLNLSSWCLVVVGWLFLTVPQGCLQFVIVVFPDHTHLLFYKLNKRLRMLIGVYTCQNITFLEITCRGSNVLWLFLTVPWVDLQCVIVVFPGHTHLLF